MSSLFDSIGSWWALLMSPVWDLLASLSALIAGQ